MYKYQSELFLCKTLQMLRPYISALLNHILDRGPKGVDMLETVDLVPQPVRRYQDDQHLASSVIS